MPVELDLQEIEADFLIGTLDAIDNLKHSILLLNGHQVHGIMLEERRQPIINHSSH